MYKASINEFTFEIESGISPSLNGEPKSISFSTIDNKRFSLSVNGIHKEANLVKIDKELNAVILRIEGKKYTVQIKQPVDILLEQLGINTKSKRKSNQLIAPMPGLIIKVLAEKGKSYNVGDPLLVLEAMKMENVFKASNDVIIKDIHIEEKQSVEKGQVLLMFE